MYVQYITCVIHIEWFHSEKIKPSSFALCRVQWIDPYQNESDVNVKKEKKERTHAYTHMRLIIRFEMLDMEMEAIANDSGNDM